METHNQNALVVGFRILTVSLVFVGGGVRNLSPKSDLRIKTKQYIIAWLGLTGETKNKNKKNQLSIRLSIA